MDSSDGIYEDPQRLFETMTFPEVKLAAEQYSKDIFTAQRELVNVLDKYEETLIKRWLKKPMAQRQKVLTSASPGIPLTHRPDFWALRKESPAQRRLGTQYRDHWLLPSLNQQDLSKPRNLLLFLRSRARNPPGLFVNADANSIHVGHTARAFMPPYLSGYTMLLSGQNTQAAYGRMLAWDEDDQAFEMMRRGTGLQPGKGLQVLEIQQRKMQFLLKCVKVILQDLPLNELDLPNSPVPAQILLPVNSSEWPSLTEEIEEAPYKVQDALDLDRLRPFIVARRNEAEDYIWCLREDPSYFHEVVLEWSEHRKERLLSPRGKTHPVLHQNIFWQRVLSNVIVDAYFDFLTWDLVLKAIDHLIHIKSEQANQTSPSEELAESFAQALAHFEHMVEQFIKGPAGKWEVGMVSSPPLRQHYVRESQDPISTRIKVMSKDASRKKGDHLLWLLEVFLQKDQLFLCGLENVCDELEREIRSNRASRERISPYIAKVISDFSLFGELKRQIGLATPGPRMTEVLEQADKHTEYDEKTKLMSRIFSVLTKTDMQLAEVGTPLGKFNYSSNKRQTAASTLTMQKAEKNLDVFWTHVDDHCRGKTGKTIHGMLNGILEDRQLQRTPDWVEHDPKSQHSKGPSDPDMELSQFAAIELQSRTEKTISTAIAQVEEKAKAKTRGLPRNASFAPERDFENDAHTENDFQIPMFDVSKRGFKVFTTLFHTSTEEEPPGDLPWSDFLSAMASIGFSIKKLDGSAWVFAPVDDKWKQSTQGLPINFDGLKCRVTISLDPPAIRAQSSWLDINIAATQAMMGCMTFDGPASLYDRYLHRTAGTTLVDPVSSIRITIGKPGFMEGPWDNRTDISADAEDEQPGHLWS
ncbi:MAG: hypothetical protein LQ348_003254 [Seirophora lacunosa]|nr:MAG: hypothetical protein LQ348_003254 [Seirophora lacunosa]